MQGTIAVLSAFLRLGCTSFGGPVAHLGYFRREFVDRRKWLSEEDYADLVALCQFLPGPASSQLAFALGMRRAGLAGGIAASLGFTLPSALLMILFALGLVAWGGDPSAGWVHGLKLAAVAVVAQAVWGMARSLCTDVPRVALALVCAGIVLAWPGAAGQISVMVAGGLAGWVIYRRTVRPGATLERTPLRNHVAAGGTLLAFTLLLFGLPALARTAGHGSLDLFDSFYRAGSLVFGGGHVVLPLLRAEVVPAGWVGDEAFLAGYGAAQALPGPLFTFAAYLGAAASIGPGGWWGGLLCTVAIFLPALLLIGGALPFWHALRAQAWAQAALRGTNAAVVGILLAAFWHPVCREGIHGGLDIAVAAAAFTLLHFARAPAWLVVALCAAAGMLRA
jgi:chromate transporter